MRIFAIYPKAHELTRLEYYAAKLLTGQYIQGSGKTYADLKTTYQIAILANEQFFQDAALVHTFWYYDPINQASLNGKTRIITLELCKTEQVITKPVAEMAAWDKWAAFLQYLTEPDKREKINEILYEEEGIAMACETLVSISQDEREYARLLSEEKNFLDYKDGMITARREGIQQGHTETARNALAEGLSIALIHKITGLDMTTLKELQTEP